MRTDDDAGGTTSALPSGSEPDLHEEYFVKKALRRALDGQVAQHPSPNPSPKPSPNPHLTKGGAEELGAATGLGAKNNVKRAEEGKKVSQPVSLCTRERNEGSRRVSLTAGRYLSMPHHASPLCGRTYPDRTHTTALQPFVRRLLTHAVTRAGLLQLDLRGCRDRDRARRRRRARALDADGAAVVCKCVVGYFARVVLDSLRRQT